MKSKKIFSNLMLFGTLLGVGLGASSISSSLGLGGQVAYAQQNYNYQGTGTIHIHKVTNTNGDGNPVSDIDNKGKEIALPNGVKPLEGVEFSYVKLTKDEAKSLGWTDSDTTKGQHIDDAKARLLLNKKYSKVSRMKTDSQGNIDIPIQVNTDDLTDNLYLIVETGTVKGVVEEAYPMIVNVPELNGSDDQYFNYDVHVYPKNYFQLNSAELDKKDEDGKALAGTVFELRKDDGSDQVVGTYKTDSTGKLTVDGLELGDYYFLETDLGTDANRTTYLLDGKKFKFSVKRGETAKVVLDVTNYKRPVITKVIDKETVDTGEDVQYTLKPSIPGNIGNYEKYVVKDVLGAELTYDSSEVIEGMTLDTDYSIERDGQTTNYVFTESGMDKLQKQFDAGDRFFTILMNAHTNSKAKMDTPLKNDVSTIYNNGYEPEDETPVDHAYTIIGDHQFIKTDGDTSKALSGAKFVVKNKIDPNKVTYLKQDPTTKAVTWIADKSKATEFVSGSDGKFQIEGLQYTYDVDFDKQGNPTITDKKINDYALEEVVAPSGYTPTRNDVPFVVSNDDASSEVTDIKNLKTPETVRTGGIGTVVFLVVAGVAGTGLYVVYKREQHKA
ncbi:TPA: SpaA isopeptide-forming pilin-related protein [Enterococcus faecium]